VQIQSKLARIYQVNAFSNLKRALLLADHKNGYVGELRDLKLGYLFNDPARKQLLTELVCRLYRLEQWEASQQPTGKLLTYLRGISDQSALCAGLLLKWWSRLSDSNIDTEVLIALFGDFCKNRGKAAGSG
jgi:hypothetical protein